jgi:hypothetical protein
MKRKIKRLSISRGNFCPLLDLHVTAVEILSLTAGDYHRYGTVLAVAETHFPIGQSL